MDGSAKVLINVVKSRTLQNVSLGLPASDQILARGAWYSRETGRLWH